MSPRPSDNAQEVGKPTLPPTRGARDKGRGEPAVKSLPVRRAVALLFLLVLSSLLCLSTPAVAGGRWKLIGKVTVMVGTEFLKSMATSAGTTVGQEAAERLLEQYRPPQAGESEQHYQTPYGTLVYKFQEYQNGVPMYHAVLIPQAPVYSGVALTCFTYYGWCPSVMPLPQGALCLCFTPYGSIYGIAQ